VIVAGTMGWFWLWRTDGCMRSVDSFCYTSVCEECICLCHVCMPSASVVQLVCASYSKPFEWFRQFPCVSNTYLSTTPLYCREHYIYFNSCRPSTVVYQSTYSTDCWVLLRTLLWTFAKSKEYIMTVKVLWNLY